MSVKLLPLLIGFTIDLLIGDPHGFPHPVILIGKLIASLERLLRRIFPKTPGGERSAGIVLWVIVVVLSAGIPLLILHLCGKVSPWLRIAAESIMCWQILALRSLRDESMKVHTALTRGTLTEARRAVSMIVGRDTDRLDEKGVIRAAVETVAENTSDGIIAPLLFMAFGGAPAGFFYKAVNTMDSMLGYIDPPYTDLGFFPAKADDVFNFIPARLSALGMIAAAALTGFDGKNAARIWRRDRRKHASPNSAQTESVCAGALHIQLAGDAYYFGKRYEKPFIGDPDRPVEAADISRSCRLMYGTSIVLLAVLEAAGYLILHFA